MDECGGIHRLSGSMWRIRDRCIDWISGVKRIGSVKERLILVKRKDWRKCRDGRGAADKQLYDKRVWREIPIGSCNENSKNTLLVRSDRLHLSSILIDILVSER